jgi:hypothetical protein
MLETVAAQRIRGCIFFVNEGHKAATIWILWVQRLQFQGVAAFTLS